MYKNDRTWLLVETVLTDATSNYNGVMEHNRRGAYLQKMFVYIYIYMLWCPILRLIYGV